MFDGSGAGAAGEGSGMAAALVSAGSPVFVASLIVGRLPL
jgi:K+-transporting ATPase A subunit